MYLCLESTAKWKGDIAIVKTFKVLLRRIIQCVIPVKLFEFAGAFDGSTPTRWW
jgi:hypothetical protein